MEGSGGRHGRPARPGEEASSTPTSALVHQVPRPLSTTVVLFRNFSGVAARPHARPLDPDGCQQDRLQNHGGDCVQDYKSRTNLTTGVVGGSDNEQRYEEDKFCDFVFSLSLPLPNSITLWLGEKVLRKLLPPGDQVSPAWTAADQLLRRTKPLPVGPLPPQEVGQAG